MSRSLVILFALLSAPAAFAAGGGGVDTRALPLFEDQGFWSFLTNSVLSAGLVALLILWFVRGAMKNPQLVPGKKQNAVEFIVEFLYGQVEKILGPKVTKQAFPLLATLFIFIVLSNLCGLLPGVGTIGWSEHIHGWAINHVERPLLRPATADMNLTLGMALAATFVWFYITVKDNGLWGFLVHTFGPKGGLKGVMGVVLAVIFFAVGGIEIVSILMRPVTLSLRLYGNIFAGENLLHSMSNLGETLNVTNSGVKFALSVLCQIPFYFMELLVAVLQGMVFAMLNVVFIKLTTTHDESHGHDDTHSH